MSKWGKVQGDSGILRKSDGPEKTEDLLVFGYACKLFRDDEKALEIDQGKHLIPWMGDDTLKIDRYDGRGALADLVQYEASTESYDTARWLGLTESERRLEQLCDEERYRAMHTNEDEEQMYREEELKRLHQQLSNEKNYGQVSYSYDASKTEENSMNDAGNAEADDDEPFVPPPDLDLPINMPVPETVKQNARIEKTALFISQQGAQMEILLKAKQAGNPQFAFLSHDSPLYRYYRHVLMAMKTGRYRPPEPEKEPEPQEAEDNDHYLHPSLAPVTPRVEAAPSIPNILYKPSADCAYTMLISKIKGTKPVVDEPEVVVAAPVTNAQSTPTTSTTYNFPPNSTYLYNYATGKYEPATPSTYTSNTQFVANHAYTGENNSYSNMYMQAANGSSMASYSAYMQNFTQSNANNAEIAKGAVLYSKNGTSQPTNIDASTIPQPYMIPPQPSHSAVPLSTVVTKEKPKPLLPIAHYSSGSDSESGAEDDSQTMAIINVPKYIIPPDEVQLIVDKMASYVARNGRDFESIVRAKGDPRFSFLDSAHTFNAYYKHKLKMYGGIVEEDIEPKEPEKLDEVSESGEPDESVSDDNDEIVENTKTLGKGEKSKKLIAPVCFSIKKAKEPDAVAIEKSALPVEESSEESGNEENEIKCEETPKEEENILENVKDESVPFEIPITPSICEDHVVVSEEVDQKPPEQQIIEIEDSIHELIDLTDDTEERRDARRAEDKIKDKLAAAAREKMSLMSRNRELQIERKRRAAAFLSKIKPDDVPSVNGGADGNSCLGNDIVRPVEEDDLMKRICEMDAATTVSGIKSSDGRSDIKISSGHNRSRSMDKHRSKLSRKKRKKRSSSSESPRKIHKRSKHSHRSFDKKRSKKKHRSRSRSHNERSRSNSHRSSRPKVADDKAVQTPPMKKERRTESHRKSEEKSSGEVSSPASHHSCN